MTGPNPTVELPWAAEQSLSADVINEVSSKTFWPLYKNKCPIPSLNPVGNLVFAAGCQDVKIVPLIAAD